MLYSLGEQLLICSLVGACVDNMDKTSVGWCGVYVCMYIV